MIEAVSDTGIRHDVARAGAHRRGLEVDFYEHFESKQECFVATLDEIVAR